MKAKVTKLLVAAIWAIAFAFSAKAHATDGAFPVACKPAVQAIFDRGVAALDGGAPDLAYEAFAEIARVDPACAMAYWGAASAIMGNLRTEPTALRLSDGAATIAVAKALGGKTERECELIDAVAQFYHRYDERSQDMRLVYYERSLARSRSVHPDDPEIARRYDVAWKAAWMRASERVEAAYALQTGP